MTTTTYPLLPFDELPRAVALTYAELLSKQSVRGETPYANAFCRIVFGKSRPTKQQLFLIAECRSDTIPVIMRKLDFFLYSNGDRRYLVNSDFARKAFPSKLVSDEARFEGHYEMIAQRHNNITNKELKAHTEQLAQSKQQILSVQNRSLPTWVSDNENLSEVELKQCLNHWYKHHNTSNWMFNELYSEMSASRIALDLSFD